MNPIEAVFEKTAVETPEISPDSVVKRRFDSDTAPKLFLAVIAFSAVAIVFSIILYISYLSIPAFREVGVVEFLTGEYWIPSIEYYGALPLIAGTLLVTAGALLISIPLGLAAAIYLSELASERVRNILKPICEVFAGIPSTVFGFFGLVVLCPFLLKTFPNQMTYATSWLAGSIILGIMALPTIITVSEDSLRAVPCSFREASLAMGATRWETIRQVVLPGASSGVIASFILGIGRVMGETMAVVMVTGSVAIIPEPLWNVFSGVRTMTATLVREMPEVVFGSTHYSSLFAVALILMISVVTVNLIASHIGRRTKVKMGAIPPSRFSVAVSEKMGKIIPQSASENYRRFKPLLRKILASMFVFAVTWMALSLFTNVITTTLVAFAVLSLFLAASTVSRRVNRKAKQEASFWSLRLSMFMVIGILVFILGYLMMRGLPVLSWDFLTQYPRDNGRQGGIFPAILGTVQLMVGMAFIMLPLGICTGIYLSLYAKQNSRTTGLIRQAINALNGTPSIVFGLFGMSVFVILFGWGYSLIAGCIVLAFMELPVVIKTTEEAISAVPRSMMEASMAMGVSKWKTIVHVILPAAAGGVVTGVILSIGRAAGETAPIMFTAVTSLKFSISADPGNAVMALPYHLYRMATEVPNAGDIAYGVAVVLLMLVLSMFLLASLVRHHYSKNTKW